MKKSAKKPAARSSSITTMFMGEAARAQAKGTDRTNAKLPMGEKADRAMKKTEKYKKPKHLPLI